MKKLFIFFVILILSSPAFASQRVVLVNGDGEEVSKEEDASHSSADGGFQVLAVRKDDLAALAGTDGDYSPIQVDEDGALFSVAKHDCGITLRSASGDLTAGETTTAITGLESYRGGIVRLDVTKTTTADADDEVDYYIQTSYNGGTDWADIENVHYGNGDNGTTEILLLTIGQLNDSPGTPVTETDGSLADGTQNDIPLGDRIRIKTAVTGDTAPTYAYNAEACFRE